MRLYKSLLPDFDKGESGPGTLFVAREVPALVGYKCGNTQQGGCLTLEQNVRLHSCDKSSNCAGIDDKIVWIRPIIYRSRSGQEINEIGIGGGAGDLTQRPEIELDSGATIQALIELYVIISIVVPFKS
jgi:DNA cross-link repair 1C protein